MSDWRSNHLYLAKIKGYNLIVDLRRFINLDEEYLLPLDPREIIEMALKGPHRKKIRKHINELHNRRMRYLANEYLTLGREAFKDKWVRLNYIDEPAKEKAIRLIQINMYLNQTGEVKSYEHHGYFGENIERNIEIRNRLHIKFIKWLLPNINGRHQIFSFPERNIKRISGRIEDLKIYSKDYNIRLYKNIIIEKR